jgi:hypothetical protein
MEEIQAIRNELENTSTDYYCIIDMIKFALYVLVSEQKINQETYDLLISKFDIANRKFTRINQIANQELTRIENF